MALLVTDEATKALLELAAKYEAVADNLIGPPGGGQPPISTMRRTGRLLAPSHTGDSFRPVATCCRSSAPDQHDAPHRPAASALDAGEQLGSAR